LKKVPASRNTISLIIRGCIAPTIKEDLFKVTEVNPFSLSLDQSADKFGANYLTICVKYLLKNSPIEPKPTTRLGAVFKMGDSKTVLILKFDRVKIGFSRKISIKN